MQDDIDDRRSRYREADERAAHHDPYDEPADAYDSHDDHLHHYADEDPRYGERYEDFPPLDDGYEEPAPARRSRLVPILAAIASVLVVAIAVVGILYFLGVFDSRSAPAPSVTAGASDPIDLTGAAAPDIPDMRDVRAVAAPADEPEIDLTAAPDVRDAAVSIAPPAQGEPPVRSTHGDWQVRCDTPAGAQGEQCVLMQFVTAEDRDNVGLTVIVLKTADGKARLMRILAPLGVLLPSGLGLKIDETDIGRAGFVRCLPNGCVAEVILEENLLDQLEGGETATFIIFQTPEEGIGIPISLVGFEPGFQALP